MNVYCRDLGQMDYKACWDLQQTLFDALTAGKTNRTAAPESATPSSEEAGTILLVEHPPVYTLGKSGTPRTCSWAAKRSKRWARSSFT